MAKSKVVISLTGVMDKRFSVIENKDAAFGFYIKFKDKLYEPDICLLEVIDKNTTSGEAADDFDEDGCCSSGFDNIQGNIIEV